MKKNKIILLNPLRATFLTLKTRKIKTLLEICGADHVTRLLTVPFTFHWKSPTKVRRLPSLLQYNSILLYIIQPKEGFLWWWSVHVTIHIPENSSCPALLRDDFFSHIYQQSSNYPFKLPLSMSFTEWQMLLVLGFCCVECRFIYLFIFIFIFW